MSKLTSEAVPATSPSVAPTAPPSRALATAALAGLLCASTSACSSKVTNENQSGVTGPTCCVDAGSSGSGGASGGGKTSSGGGSSSGGKSAVGGTSSGTGGTSVGTDGGSGGSTPGAGGTSSSDAAALSTGGTDGATNTPPAHDAGVPCGMPDGSVPYVTSTTNVATMTQEQFTTLCDARHGTVEIPPHCGGFNTCMGFSWWADTGDLTEHTCRGMSSCVGFSCVVCPPK